ncbi:MAG: holo-ACP synthase [Syntrophaceae bacterium]|jgi:holo-[acyl-carrier protein] synthase|nr:holo-ACP synthase [Syntrophaceae bacterium]
MIYGIGTDLVEVNRMEKIIQRWGERFTEKVYSQDEIDYCTRKAYPAIHYAARFAAKESFLKSLGIGLGMGVSLKDIEVINNAQGNPQLKMNERIRKVLDTHGITSVQISMTHTREHAHAVVILEQ